MPCRVVCISSTDGAGAEAIGVAVADRLGFRVVNEQIISDAAREAGVDPGQVADVERRRSFIARFLEELGPSSAMAAASLGAPMPYDPSPASDDLRGLIRAAIEAVAEEGDAVIVAHAASYALADSDRALRVLVTGSPARRRERLAETSSLSQDEAGRVVKKGDAGRADYLKRFYGVDAEDASHYDLVVNTDRLDAESASRVIAEAAAA